MKIHKYLESSFGAVSHVVISQVFFCGAPYMMVQGLCWGGPAGTVCRYSGKALRA